MKWHIKKLIGLSFASLAVPACFLLLSACGSSSSGTPTTPQGIYSGTITGGRGGPGFGPNGDEKGIIYNNRMMVFSTISDIQQLLDTALIISDTSISGTVSFYNNKTAPIIGTASLSGSFVTATSVAATFIDATDSNILDGTINLTANTALFNKGSAQATLTGSWQGTHGGVGIGDNATTLAIDAAGVISGSDVEGCSLTGSISPANSALNVYTVSITSTGGASCTSLPPATYTGLAWTEGNADTTLNLTVADGTYSRAVILTKT